MLLCPSPCRSWSWSRQGRPSRGKAQQASQPSQGRALQARWQSQARQHSLQEQQLRRRSRRTAAEGGCVVVLAESVAWLGSATSPGVLCLGSAGSLAVPCLGSVCLVLTGATVPLSTSSAAYLCVHSAHLLGHNAITGSRSENIVLANVKSKDLHCIRYT